MPELPEVETIKNVLKHNLMNKTVKNVELFYQPLLEEDSEHDIKALENSQFTKFDRRGKFLIFGFSNGLYWVVHLRMEGKYHLYSEETPKSKHTHLILETEDQYVHYLDTRKFSRMAVTSDLDKYLETKNLGYEPWDEDLTVEFLRESFKNKKRAIKSSLLEQRYVTGIGNIYVDEILFRSKIHPNTAANKLNDTDLENIIKYTRLVLEQAIEEGGTTIRSYTSSLGVHGRFQVSLKAYGRKGEPCTVCGTEMSGTKIGGRSTVFCHVCQKETK